MRHTGILYPALRRSIRMRVGSDFVVSKSETALLAMDEYPLMVHFLTGSGHQPEYMRAFAEGPFDIDWKAEVKGKKYTVKMRGERHV